METKFNFKSQICTDINQSKRLLALGLKKETADMVWTHAYYGTWVATASENPLYEESDSIPAWSLHRLIEMIGDIYEVQYLGFNIEKDYDHTIDSIEWLIEDGRFSEDYLEKKMRKEGE